jgi:hypothetical protein
MPRIEFRTANVHLTDGRVITVPVAESLTHIWPDEGDTRETDSLIDAVRLLVAEKAAAVAKLQQELTVLSTRLEQYTTLVNIDDKYVGLSLEIERLGRQLERALKEGRENITE